MGGGRKEGGGREAELERHLREGVGATAKWSAERLDQWTTLLLDPDRPNKVGETVGCS